MIWRTKIKCDYFNIVNLKYELLIARLTVSAISTRKVLLTQLLTLICAVDFRLYDTKNSKYLDMGKFGAIWGQNNAAPTFSSELTNEQIANRLFLLVAASNSDLINYPYEFWHFSTGDRYAIYWQKRESMKAIYNIIKTTKD